MKIFVFGNADVEIDSLPIKILPELSKLFPQIDFLHLDPNEEWEVPEELIVIDTTLGAKKVEIFDDLDAFATAPQFSLHDFDALQNLKLLKKMGKIKKIKIIGIAPTISESEAINGIEQILKAILLSKNESNN